MPTGYSNKNGKNPFKGKKRKPFSLEHKLKISISGKGRIAWNKGLINLDKASDETKAKMSKAHSNEKHHGWKGDDAGYSALHSWVARKKGPAKDYKCSECESIEHLQWSNKDHKYRRVLGDWRVLCASCHRKYDFNNNLIKLSAKI